MLDFHPTLFKAQFRGIVWEQATLVPGLKTFNVTPITMSPALRITARAPQLVFSPGLGTEDTEC